MNFIKKIIIVVIISLASIFVICDAYAQTLSFSSSNSTSIANSTQIFSFSNQTQVNEPYKTPSPLLVPAVQQPFSISVNNHTDVSLISLTKGESKQINVHIHPLISGMSGTMGIHNALPICETTSLHIPCIHSGIDVFISKSTVSTEQDMTLTISVPSNMTTGIYPYAVSISTTENDTQNRPVRVIVDSTFGVNVQ